MVKAKKNFIAELMLKPVKGIFGHVCYLEVVTASWQFGVMQGSPQLFWRLYAMSGWEDWI